MRACTERASSICPWKTWRKRPGNMHATTTKTWRCTIVHSYARTYCTYVAATLWRPADQPENSATDRRSFLCLFLNESSVLPEDFIGLSIVQSYARTYCSYVAATFGGRPASRRTQRPTGVRRRLPSHACIQPTWSHQNAN
jgi:hypothetical protein